MSQNNTNMELYDVEDASRVRRPVTLRRRFARAFRADNYVNGYYVSPRGALIFLSLTILQLVIAIVLYIRLFA